MKIALISDQDFGNLGYQYADALCQVGIESKSFSLTKHPYSYERQSVIVKPEELSDSIQKYDIVILMHTSIKLIKYIGDRPWFVMHGGSRYRQGHEAANEVLKNAKGAIIQTPDLLGLGAINEELICAPIDLNRIPYIPFHKAKHRFGHYPSNIQSKGTNQIKLAANQARIDLDVNTQLLPHRDNLKRIGECEVYIELFNPLQRGKPYGTFGITALEAALIGRPVITMCANYDKYMERYDNDYFDIVTTEAELIESMQDCQQASVQSLEEWGLRCRDVVATMHHPARIGNQLIEFINSKL